MGSSTVLVCSVFDVFLEKVSSRCVMNGVVIDQRLGAVNPFFSVNSSGCPELESTREVISWSILPPYLVLSSTSLFGSHHLNFCSKAEVRAVQNLDFQIFRKRRYLQEMLRPENWAWSKLLWQHFIPALNISSH